MRRSGLRMWKAMKASWSGRGVSTSGDHCRGESSSRAARLQDPAPTVQLGHGTVPVHPGPPRHTEMVSRVSDRDKTGATLLFSGLFLGLVGMTFTAMGWLGNSQSRAVEWTQLLGPILLSVGATFMIISVCKFRMLACRACACCYGNNHDTDHHDGMAEEAELAQGQSFVFCSINQSITGQHAALAGHVPPPYASIMQEASIPGGVSLHQQVCVGTVELPQYCSVSPPESLERLHANSLVPSAPSSRRPSRSPQEGEERQQGAADMKADQQDHGEDDTNGVFPPAYEDLYPSLTSQRGT